MKSNSVLFDCFRICGWIKIWFKNESNYCLYKSTRANHKQPNKICHVVSCHRYLEMVFKEEKTKQLDFWMKILTILYSKNKTRLEMPKWLNNNNTCNKYLLYCESIQNQRRKKKKTNHIQVNQIFWLFFSLIFTAAKSNQHRKCGNQNWNFIHLVCLFLWCSHLQDVQLKQWGTTKTKNREIWRECRAQNGKDKEEHLEWSENTRVENKCTEWMRLNC